MNKWSLIVPRFGTYGFLKNLVFFEPFLILFLREQGISFFQIGILIAVREITINLTEIPTGIIADIMGRRRAMLGSFLSYILSFVMFYCSQSYIVLVLAMIFFGFGEAFRSGTHKAMIMEYMDLKGKECYKSVQVFSFVRAWSQIGSALSTLLAAGLVFYSGQYKIVFLATIIPYLLNAALILTYPCELDGKHEVKTDLRSIFQFVYGSMKRMLWQPMLRRIILNSALDKGLYKVLKDYLQPVVAVSSLMLFPFLPTLVPGVDKKQVTAIAIAVVYSSIYIFNALASVQTERLERWFKGTCRALNITYLFYIVTMLVAFGALLWNWWWITVLCFMLIGGIQNVRRPMIISFLERFMDRKERATVMSVETQLQILMTMLLAPLLGALADRFGLAAVFVAAFSVFTVFGYLLRLRDDRSNPQKCS